MKKLLIIPLLLLSIISINIFNSNDVYAVEIDTNLQFNKVLYNLYKYDPNTELDYFDIYLQTGISNTNTYNRNLIDVTGDLMLYTTDTFIFTFNKNYLMELYRGTGNSRTQYESLGYVSMIYAKYSAGDFELSFYDENHDFIRVIRPTELPYDDIFLHSSYINLTATVENAFDSGRQQGFDEGKRIGDREGYERGFESARDLFAYYLEDQDAYLPAVNWGVTEYNRGLNEGLQSTEGEAYNQGFIDGSSDSFMASIKDWIVPAIIVVLFLGGAVTIILRKREV